MQAGCPALGFVQIMARGQLFKQECGQHARLRKLLAERFRAQIAHKGIGVVLIGQKQESQRDIVAQERQAHIQCFPGRTTARPVAIKAENDAIAGAQQFLNMSRRRGRTQRGHRKSDACCARPTTSM